jgi:hypothetical protein
MTTSITPPPSAPAKESSGSLVRIVVMGLAFGAVSTVVMTLSSQRLDSSVKPAAPTMSASAMTLPPLEASNHGSAVTAAGEITPSAAAAVVDSLTKDGPIADPGGKTPKPRNGALFHRMVQGDATIRVYTVTGTPEAVMTAFAKDLETAGFHRDDEGAKGAKTDPTVRVGRLKRVYSNKDTESLITVNRSEAANQTLVTIVEGRRDEP